MNNKDLVLTYAGLLFTFVVLAVLFLSASGNKTTRQAFEQKNCQEELSTYIMDLKVCEDSLLDAQSKLVFCFY